MARTAVYREPEAGRNLLFLWADERLLLILDAVLRRRQTSGLREALV